VNTKGAKQIWIVLLVIAVLVAGFGWWGSNRVRRSIAEDLQQQLQTVLNANVTALEIWMTNQQKLATAIAEDSQVQQLAIE
jgi:C4-dicarboxylate-specific signal transduction histidine kinase